MNTIWISHRGLKNQASENTRESFQAALKAGFLYFEADLRVTADEHLILSHDPNFGRLSHHKKDIISMTRSECAKIEFYDGSRPYFFDEFIEDLAAYSWVLDIKPEFGFKTIAALEKWVTKRHAQDWFETHAKFLVWTLRDENHLKTVVPGAKLYARQMECWQAGLMTLAHLSFLGRIKPHKTYAIPPTLGGFFVLRKEIVQEFHKRKAQVVAFLPKTPEEEALALEAGVDEILTDGMPAHCINANA